MSKATQFTRSEVLSHLLAFNHGYRTDLTKRTLCNADAVAFILFNLGTCTRNTLRSIMREWRGTQRMLFTYLFNSSHSGGYGFVAESPFQTGNWMNSGWSGFWTGGYNKHSSRQLRRKNEHVPGQNFFRRTYWFRSAKGTYTLTIEGGVRVRELAKLFA